MVRKGRELGSSGMLEIEEVSVFQHDLGKTGRCLCNEVYALDFDIAIVVVEVADVVGEFVERGVLGVG
jgi:hypothetical protein